MIAGARRRRATGQLERYRLGELPADRSASASGRALDADDGDLAERLAGLDRSDREILARHPAAVIGAVHPRAAGSRRRRAAAPRGRPRPPRSRARRPPGRWPRHRRADVSPPGAGRERDTTRVKGLAPRLLVFREGAARRRRSSPRGASRARTTSCSSPTRPRAATSARSSRSTPAAWSRATFPPRAPWPAPLKTGALFALPEAYRLDDAPGFERFYLVTADQPFAVDRRGHGRVATRRGSGGPAGPPRAGLDQYSFALRKETAR